jgi:2-methylaconitate cis-trans-isomerase PrpF
MHPTFMGTGSCCFAAAANIKGTLPHEMMAAATTDSPFIFGHPGGLMPLEVEVNLNDDCNKTTFTKLGFGRTSRKIAECSIYVKQETLDSLKPELILPRKQDDNSNRKLHFPRDSHL